MKTERVEGYVKKETMYLVIAVSLLIGFLCGVVFTIYKAPLAGNDQSPHAEHQHQQEEKDLSAEEKLAADNPDDPEAWIHLGNAYFDTDQPAKAIKAYEKALELVPGNANVLTDLGVMHRRNGDSKKAVEAFDRAIEADPTHELARLNKGVVLMFDLNDQDGAFQAWEQLLSMNPTITVPNGQLLRDFMQDLRKGKE